MSQSLDFFAKFSLLGREEISAQHPRAKQGQINRYPPGLCGVTSPPPPQQSSPACCFLHPKKPESFRCETLVAFFLFPLRGMGHIQGVLL